jgi:hypothetical protein
MKILSNGKVVLEGAEYASLLKNLKDAQTTLKQEQKYRFKLYDEIKQWENWKKGIGKFLRNCEDARLEITNEALNADQVKLWIRQPSMSDRDPLVTIVKYK